MCFNASMSIKTGELGSASNVFRSIGLAVAGSNHPSAYVNCCHAFTASVIALNIDQIPDDMNVVLLGYKGEVLHSILVTNDGEIAADTQRQIRKLDSSFNAESGSYSSRLYAQSQRETHYDVIAMMSIREFKQNHLSLELDIAA